MSKDSFTPSLPSADLRDPFLLFAARGIAAFCTEITEGIMGERPRAPRTLLLGSAPAQAAFPAGLVVGGVAVSLLHAGPQASCSPHLTCTAIFPSPGSLFGRSMLVLLPS